MANSYALRMTAFTIAFNAVGVSLPQLPDEGNSGEAGDGTKTATGNEESHASPLAGGQMHKHSVQVSFIFVVILLMSI